MLWEYSRTRRFGKEDSFPKARSRKRRLEGLRVKGQKTIFTLSSTYRQKYLLYISIGIVDAANR